MDMTEREKAIYALAASWASIDGKLEAFGEERFARSRAEAPTGHYEGYLVEAEEMLERLEKRGFTICPASPKRRALAPVSGSPTNQKGGG